VCQDCRCEELRYIGTSGCTLGEPGSTQWPKLIGRQLSCGRGANAATTSPAGVPAVWAPAAQVQVRGCAAGDVPVELGGGGVQALRTGALPAAGCGRCGASDPPSAT